MPKKSSRSFAVGTKHGARSAMWIVSLQKNGDVYVTTAGRKHLLKFTLHPSGKWHLKRIGVPKPHDQVIWSHKNKIARGFYPVALFIIIPNACLHPAINPDDPKVTSVPDLWIEPPSSGGCIEIGIMRWKPSDLIAAGINTEEQWPGQSSGTECLFSANMALDKQLGIFARALDANHFIAMQASAENERAARGVQRFHRHGNHGFVVNHSIHGGLHVTEVYAPVPHYLTRM